MSKCLRCGFYQDAMLVRKIYGLHRNSEIDGVTDESLDPLVLLLLSQCVLGAEMRWKGAGSMEVRVHWAWGVSGSWRSHQIRCPLSSLGSSRPWEMRNVFALFLYRHILAEYSYYKLSSSYPKFLGIEALQIWKNSGIFACTYEMTESLKTTKFAYILCTPYRHRLKGHLMQSF